MENRFVTNWDKALSIIGNFGKIQILKIVRIGIFLPFEVQKDLPGKNHNCANVQFETFLNKIDSFETKKGDFFNSLYICTYFLKIGCIFNYGIQIVKVGYPD